MSQLQLDHWQKVSQTPKSHQKDHIFETEAKIAV